MLNCESGISPSCAGVVRPIRQSEGHTVCNWCEEEAKELQQRHEYEAKKQKIFDSAKTVDDLKSWIVRYML